MQLTHAAQILCSATALFRHATEVPEIRNGLVIRRVEMALFELEGTSNRCWAWFDTTSTGRRTVVIQGARSSAAALAEHKRRSAEGR